MRFTTEGDVSVFFIYAVSFGKQPPFLRGLYFCRVAHDSLHLKSVTFKAVNFVV